MKTVPERKKIRLSNYDYSSSGVYFITICTQNKTPYFRKTDFANSLFPLSHYGEIIDTLINEIPDHYSNVTVGTYSILPDHIHMLLIISEPSGKNISTIINQFKGIATKRIRNVSSSTVKIWQKSFFEHIIRNELDYQEKWNYIEGNVQKWINRHK